MRFAIQEFVVIRRVVEVGDDDLLVSLQGSPGAKVENGGFECWTRCVAYRVQLLVVRATLAPAPTTLTCSERSLIRGSRTGEPRPRWVQGCPAQTDHQII